jgi:hypothetical protein
MKLYNITQIEAKELLNYCNNNIETLALILWNKGKAKSIENGINKAKKIKNFANK